MCGWQVAIGNMRRTFRAICDFEFPTLNSSKSSSRSRREFIQLDGSISIDLLYAEFAVLSVLVPCDTTYAKSLFTLLQTSRRFANALKHLNDYYLPFLRAFLAVHLPVSQNQRQNHRKFSNGEQLPGQPGSNLQRLCGGDRGLRQEVGLVYTVFARFDRSFFALLCLLLRLFAVYPQSQREKAKEHYEFCITLNSFVFNW